MVMSSKIGATYGGAVVRVECDRCGYVHPRTEGWVKKQRDRFGTVYCTSCAELVRAWARRGGHAYDLPKDAEIVIISAGEPLGPPL